MTQRVEKQTVLFADICSSTRIVKQRGDMAARTIFRHCLRRVAGAVTRHGGRVVGQLGDELMCLFPDVGNAIAAGLAILDAVEAGGAAGEYPRDLRLHIGLHFGPLVIDGDEVFGDTIHTAKRMVDLAKPGQVLTTRSTIEATTPPPGVAPRFVEEVRIKGSTRPIAIFELVRKDQSITTLLRPAPVMEGGEHYLRCRIFLGPRQWLVDDANPVLSIGRGAACDLQIRHAGVSREHGRIELQKGRIIFIDHSTNGTRIDELHAEAPVLVHREQRWLRDRGLLLFGDDASDGTLAIGYACETGP